MERDKCSFNVDELAELVHGGAERLAVWRRTAMMCERDPVLSLSHTRTDMAREEERVLSARVAARLIELFRGDDPLTREQRDFIMAATYPGAHSRISNHTSLFSPAITLLGSPEQVREWTPRLHNFSVLGCFALSEVAHASNARGVETVAEFDPRTDEFVITSPREESGKFWIGSAGSSATHAVVYAQLRALGASHGLNAFLVPLRDTHTGELCRGVRAMDTGPKMGRNGLDNGFLVFTDVRVPRSALLSRYTQVSREGRVSTSPVAALAFGALLQGRIMMVTASAWIQAMALTICIRYMLVRRQFASPAGASPLERQVLHYPVQLRRIVPLVASVYAYMCAGNTLGQQHAKLVARMNEPASNVMAVAQELKTMHALSAALKAEASWTAYAAIDQARQACGGHGYATFSGLPDLFNDYAVFVTWEGDNTLMSLQGGRWLLKEPDFDDSGSGSPDTDFLTWWARSGTDAAPVGDSPLHRLAARATRLCVQRARKLASAAADADVVGHELVAAARQVARLYALWSFWCWLAAPSCVAASRSTKGVLQQLCALFCSEVIEQAAVVCPGCLAAAELEANRRTALETCMRLRDDVLGCVEAFNFTDFMLNSAIGKRDGDVYAHYIDRIKRQPSAFHGTPDYWKGTFGATLAKK